MKFKIIYTAFFLILLIGIACQTNTNKQELSKEEESMYLIKGQKIAAQTFATLGGQLQTAMKEGGVAHAIKYCNLNAFPLVDSLSKIHEASIRRVSLKARNPLDIPNDQEAPILRKYEDAFQNNKPLAPMIQTNQDHSVSFFAPIKVNAFCLQCHGKIGETLKQENHLVIKEKYPQDQAIGYIEGDLRGMWSITFKN